MSLTPDDVDSLSYDKLIEVSQGNIPGEKFSLQYDFQRDPRVMRAKERLQKIHMEKKWYEKPFGLILIGLIIVILGFLATEFISSVIKQQSPQQLPVKSLSNDANGLSK